MTNNILVEGFVQAKLLHIPQFLAMDVDVEFVRVLGVKITEKVQMNWHAQFPFDVSTLCNLEYVILFDPNCYCSKENLMQLVDMLSNSKGEESYCC